ncbi:MAG: ribosomal protein L32 [Planctomycetes bacterium]|nr:ribosomal protein L32 [Planctomycetota bacterium]
MSVNNPLAGWFNRMHLPSDVAGATARQASAQVRSAEFKISELQNRLDSLSLTCMAMWELLRDSGNVSDDDLMAKIREVDLRDGALDGKVKAQRIAECPRCGRTMSLRHVKCMYCGEANLSQKPFDHAG